MTPSDTLRAKAKERPILFSGPMVRAILDGRKTQTRRPIKQQPKHLSPPFPYLRPNGDWCWVLEANHMGSGLTTDGFKCPYGKPGDRLWTRETFAINDIRYGWTRPLPKEKPDGDTIVYKADGDWVEQFEIVDGDVPPWRPSIHMPRWASRINLEITGVRVEQINAITGEDAAKEGFRDLIFEEHEAEYYDLAHDWFRDIWNSINAARGFGWDQNPWVWVVEFKKVGIVRMEE